MPNATLDNPTPNDANTLSAASASEGQLIQGCNEADTITGSDYDDVVIGGYGANTVTLGDGDDVVIHRFLSSQTGTDKYTNSDGGDVINNFVVGSDKLLLVDEGGTPLADWAAFIAADQTTHGVRFDVITRMPLTRLLV